jgi:hypothetical protein
VNLNSGSHKFQKEKQSFFWLLSGKPIQRFHDQGATGFNFSGLNLFDESGEVALLAVLSPEGANGSVRL